MPKTPDKADECRAPILHLEIFNGTGMTSVVSNVFKTIFNFITFFLDLLFHSW